jgi:hypothetical protein
MTLCPRQRRRRQYEGIDEDAEGGEKGDSGEDPGERGAVPDRGELAYMIWNRRQETSSKENTTNSTRRRT